MLGFSLSYSLSSVCYVSGVAGDPLAVAGDPPPILPTNKLVSLSKGFKYFTVGLTIRFLQQRSHVFISR